MEPRLPYIQPGETLSFILKTLDRRGIKTPHNCHPLMSGKFLSFVKLLMNRAGDTQATAVS